MVDRCTSLMSATSYRTYLEFDIVRLQQDRGYGSYEMLCKYIGSLSTFDLAIISVILWGPTSDRITSQSRQIER